MPARLLIVEDDREIRTLYRLELSTLYDIVEAPDGYAAWRLFETEQPDIVLMDLGVPGINGMDLTEKIRAHEKLSDTPIIIITGSTVGEDLPPSFWLKATPASAFFEKPVDFGALREEIDRQLKARAGHRELPPGKGYYEGEEEA